MKNKKNLPDINNLKFSLNYWFKKILKPLDVNSNTIYVLHSLLAMSLFDLFVCFYFCFIFSFFLVFLWYLSLMFEIFVFVIRYQIQNNLSSLHNKNMRLFERLLPFVEFKKREKHPWRSVTDIFEKLQAEASNILALTEICCTVPLTEWFADPELLTTKQLILSLR